MIARPDRRRPGLRAWPEMIESDCGAAGIRELRRLVSRIAGESLDGATRALLQSLGPTGSRVYRLRLPRNARHSSVILKREAPMVAERNALLLRRWLPGAGAEEFAPSLLGVAADPGGACVWHVYEDLGDTTLDCERPDRARLEAAVRCIAGLHTRFAADARLGEFRLYGGDFGIAFYRTNVDDAIRALKALPGPDRASRRYAGLKERLLARLRRLRGETGARRATLAGLGPPETLLHGDLWPANASVTPCDGCWRTRLIDWDHAGVGPFSYDLSTFLSRVPASHRLFVMECYGEAVAAAGWRLPEAATLERAFETAEFSRIANRVIWPAIALREPGGSWGYESLAEIETWFTSVRPLLDPEGGAPPLRCA